MCQTTLKLALFNPMYYFLNFDQFRDDALRRKFTLAFLVRLAYDPILGYEMNVQFICKIEEVLVKYQNLGEKLK